MGTPKGPTIRSQSGHSSFETCQRGWSEGPQGEGFVRKGEEETTPEAVSTGAIRAGEIQTRWAWTEPLVWTERMLATLERGVKGGKWYSLMDKVCDERVLRAGFEKVSANKGASGVDRVTVDDFESHLGKNLKNLGEELRKGTYRASSIRRTFIPKPGTKEKRPLGIPTVRDRVVQTALRMVLEPIFENDFAEGSYGFRPGRGCKDALRKVEQLLKSGFVYIVDVDLKSYFDTIPHEGLMDLVSKRISDGKVLSLIRGFLEQSIMEDLKEYQPEMGSPQGAVISPLLSNIYLNPLDHEMAERGREMIRYADDFVIMCKTREEADLALEELKVWTAKAGLTLHPDKTKVVEAETEAFEFLGYRFEKGSRFPRKKSLQKLKDSIREKTGRSNGQSFEQIVERLNLNLKGWFEYFKHAKYWVFKDLDQWIRMRLRSILRMRSGLKGRGRGADHQKWPNEFFNANGLFSLELAHQAACQSLTR